MRNENRQVSIRHKFRGVRSLRPLDSKESRTGRVKEAGDDNGVDKMGVEGIAEEEWGPSGMGVGFSGCMVG